jgi:dimethylargininase
MLTALTRDVSPAMGACELTYVARQEIDIAKAAEQHARYKECLAGLGVHVISLPAEPDLADAVFVEDPIVVVDEVAVIARTGAASRRKEAESLAQALAEFRLLRRMREPATLEGGDVLRIGRTIFVGLSPRTNQDGVSQLTAELAPFGYTVRAVPVHGALHFKTACSYVGDDSLLVNRAWVDAAALGGYKLIDVAEDEPWAANALRIGETVLMPAGFLRTEDILRGAGFCVQSLDVSELQKAEGSVTCMSVIFENSAPSS